MNKVVCFDFDGVIINSREVQCMALKNSYQEIMGINEDPPYEEFFDQSGNSLENIFNNLKLPIEMAPIYRRISIENMDAIKINAGMPELLFYLKESGFKCALCTGKDRDRTILILEKVGVLNYFDKIVCSDDVKHPKPNPESLNLILKELGADLNYSIMIGDANNDIICAKAVNISSVGVTWGDVRKEKLITSKPDYIVDTVEILKDTIINIMNKPCRRNRFLVNDMVCAENKCNMRCDYCLTETSDFKGKDGRKNDNYITTDYSYIDGNEFKERLDTISETLHKKMNTSILKISGGEILQLSNINEFILKESKKYEAVQVLTNAVLLTDKILEEYNKAGNIFLQISIDSNTLEGNYYRTKNQKLLNHILKNLDKAYQYNIPVEINCVLTDKNCENFDQYAEYLTKYESNVIIFPFPVRGAMRDKYYPKEAQIEGIRKVIENYDHFSKIMAPKPYMEALYEYMVTDKREVKCYLCECAYGTFDDGIVTPCSNYWFMDFGNIIENPEEALENLDGNKIYELMNRKQRSIDVCKHCFTPWENLNLYFNGRMSMKELTKSPLYNVPKIKERIVLLKEQLAGRL